MVTMRHRIYIQDGLYCVKLDDPVDGWVWIETINVHGGRCRKMFKTIWDAKKSILDLAEQYSKSTCLLIEEGEHEIT